MDLIAPPLPLQWPYLPRVVPESPGCTAVIELPGLVGLWHLETSSSLNICKYGKKSELAFGRGGIIRHGSLVLRPYRRGGLVRYINTGTYMGTARFKHEFDVHKAIWKSGIPTVEPVGWAYKSKRIGNEGVFLTKFASGTPWPHTWNGSADFLTKLITILKALCSWGLYAPDLNATNILISQNEEPIALDWDQTIWSPKPNLMATYQKRLIRSMKKLGAQTDLLTKVRQLIENS